MARSTKSIAEAYLFWLFLGVVGGHRFYLGRPLFGIVLAVCSIAGAVLYISGVELDQTRRQFAGVLIGGLAVAGLVVDFAMIPRMVEEYNNPSDADRSFVRTGASLDPSFQATRRLARGDEAAEGSDDRPRKSRLPEGYEMPWRKAREKDKDRYKPGQD